jgi:hypothetical protein
MSPCGTTHSLAPRGLGKSNVKCEMTCGTSGPSDVTMRRDGQQLRAEIFAILRDKTRREAAAYWDWLMAQTRQISRKSGVGISGEITARLSPHDGKELLRQIRVAAETVVATGQARPVEFGSARLTVLPPGKAPTG